MDPDDQDVTLAEVIEVTEKMTPKQRNEALKYLYYLWRTGAEPDDETDKG